MTYSALPSRPRPVVRVRVAIAVLALMLMHVVGCGVPWSAHQIYVETMSSKIGRYVGDDYYVGGTSSLVKSRTKLPNGNTEVALYAAFGGDREACLTFFEVDKDTDIIVSWRFEGGENCIWAW